MGRKTVRGALVGVVAAGCLAWFLCATEVAHADGRFRPDPAVQKKIDELVRRLVPISEDKDASEKAFLEGVKQLKAATGGKLANVIPEMAFYNSAAKDEKIAGIGWGVMWRLVKEANAQEAIIALAPYLFSTNEAQFRSQLWEVMYAICSVQPPVPDFNFDRVFAVMAAKKGEISDNLVRYMYATRPGDAMLAYMRVDRIGRPEWKTLRLAELEVGHFLRKEGMGLIEAKAVDSAITDELKRLSESKRWWARLYVAEIMRQNHTLRIAPIVEKLKSDENRLVREAATFDKDDTEGNPPKAETRSY